MIDINIIIPCLVSDKVNPSIISLLSKMIERSILFNNYDIIKKSVIKLYLGPYRTLDESEEEDELLSLQVPQSVVDICEAFGAPRPADSVFSGQGKSKGDVEPRNAVFKKAEDIEHPPEFRFFTQINELPTTISIGIQGRTSDVTDADDTTGGATLGARVTGLRTTARTAGGRPRPGTMQRNIIVGAKCAPTVIKDLDSIVQFMQMTRTRWSLTGYFQKLFTRIFGNTSSMIPAIYKRVPTVLLNSPMIFELTNSTYLAKILGKGESSGKPASWGTVTIFQRGDFDEHTFEENIDAFNKLINGGWGDMIIVDDHNETVYVCVARTRVAYPIKYGHIKAAFALEDILDDRDPYKTGTRSFGQVGMTSIKNVIAHLSKK